LQPLPPEIYLPHLKRYEELLKIWQQKINLVSTSTLSDLWERHFQDSLQLLPYIPEDAHNLIDLGSGAGFPGLVLAIALSGKIKATLIESDLRKCLFLENVSRETFLDVVILRERIESIKEPLQGDIITARALAPLPLLIEYAFPFMKENAIALFLKGESVQKEIVEAQKKWEFDLEIFPSLTDSKASILKIKHPKRILPHD
jgi:16S rRNA (guanine527-N7)-methyltransferase